MPRRAKVAASACIVGFVGAAVWFALEHPAARGVVGAAALVGLAYIWWRVPTREAVLAERIAA